MARIMNVIVVEVLARLANDNRPLLVTGKNSTGVNYTDLTMQEGTFERNLTMPLANLTDDRGLTIDFVAERYGYQGGQRSSSMTFALVVNLMYLAVNLCFLAYFLTTVVSGWLVPVKCWSDLQDIVLLAFLSRRSAELENCGVGTDRSFSSPWDLNVKARANGEENIEMVFGDEEPEDTWRIAQNREYGWVRLRRAPSLRRGAYSYIR